MLSDVFIVIQQGAGDVYFLIAWAVSVVVLLISICKAVSKLFSNDVLGAIECQFPRQFKIYSKVAIFIKKIWL